MTIPRPSIPHRPVPAFPPALAGAVGAVLGFVLRATPGVTGLTLLSYGAWSAWHPAGWMVAGAGVLADTAWSRRAVPARGEP